MRSVPSLVVLGLGLAGLPGHATDLALGLETHESRYRGATQRTLGVVVANQGDTPAGSLVLRLPLPENGGARGEDAGGCAPNCAPGESLEWSLPELAPGEGTSLQLQIGVGPSTEPATGFVRYLPVSFELELFEAEALRAKARVEVPSKERHLMIDLAADRDPVGPGETLAYTIAFRYDDRPFVEAAPADAELTFALPDAATLVWASAGAVVSGSSLSWRIPDLRRGEGGRRVVQVRVHESAPPGEVLAAEVVLHDRGGRLEAGSAGALARVAAPPAAELAVDLGPVGPIARAANRGASSTLPLEYEPLPSGLFSRPQWVGVLEPGGSRSLPGVDFGMWDGGRLIGTPARPRARAIGVESASPRDVSLTLAADRSSGAPGDDLTYVVDFTNVGVSAVSDARLALRLPAGVELATAEDGEPTAGGVTWDLGDLAPGDGGRRSATVRLPPDLPAGSLIRALAVLGGTDAAEQEVATLSLVVGDPLQVFLTLGAEEVLPGDSVPLDVRLVNRGEASLSSVRVVFEGSGDVELPTQLSVEDSLPPGAEARLHGTLAIGPYTGPGSLLTIRAIAVASREGEPGEFPQTAEATLRVPPHLPAVPASDANAARCQAQQLHALARDCVAQLTCWYDAEPKRCFRRAFRRFQRSYEAALARAAEDGSSCPYSNPSPSLGGPLLVIHQEDRMRVWFESEPPRAVRLEAQLRKAAAGLCRAELEGWAARAQGTSAQAGVERARARFLGRARRAIARAEDGGWRYGGWTPEGLADLVRTAALRAAFFVGGAAYPWWDPDEKL